MREIWPNLFIVGAPKAGTSSLYAYFKKVPGIYMSPIKEPNYFSRSSIPDDSSLKPVRDKKKYLQLFEKVTSEKIIGEASPSYLADPDASNLIHEAIPQSKIIISLRDPIERVFSDYLMLNRLGMLQLNFHEELKKALSKKGKPDEIGVRLQHSMYYENVKRYLDVFGTKQVKVIIFEDFIKDQKTMINEILKFLNVNYNFEDFSGEAYNQYAVPKSTIAQKVYKNRGIRRVAEILFSPSQRKFLKENFLVNKEPKPKIYHEDLKLLKDYYQNDVFNVERLLKQKMPWPNFKNQ